MNEPDVPFELADLIAGEVPPDSPEGRRILRASNASTEAVAELRDLALQIEEHYAELDAPDEDTGAAAPGEEQIVELLLGIPLGSPRPTAASPSRPTWVDWLLPVAALLLLVPLLSHWLSDGGGRRREHELMQGDRGSEGAWLDWLAPPPPGQYGALRWSVDHPSPLDQVVLQVYEEGRDDPLVYPLTDSPWSDPAAQATWPDSALLVLEVRRGSELSAYAWLRASRR